MKIEQTDINLVGLVEEKIVNLQNQLNAVLTARDSLIQMLETKYDAHVDKATGQFVPNEKEKDAK